MAINTHRNMAAWRSKDYTCNNEVLLPGFFAEMLYKSLPDRIRNDLKTNPYTFIDYGCKSGEGTAILADYFPGISFLGVDPSEEAIKNANNSKEFKRENCKYKVTDTEADSLGSADVLYAAVIDQAEEQRALLEELVKFTNKYAFFLLSFDDADRKGESTDSLDIESIPNTIGSDFDLSFFNVIDCRASDYFWQGQMLLLVFQKRSKDSRLSLNEIYNAQIKPLIEDNYKSRKARVASERADKVIMRMSEKESGKAIKAAENAVKACQALQTDLSAMYGSAPFKMAHFSVELKQILTGPVKAKKEGLNWLVKDRTSVTSVNYLSRIGKLSASLEEEMKKADTSSRALNEGVLLYEDLKKVLEFIISANADTVFVHPSLLDWNVPLFQRPQQIFMSLGRLGYPVIYFTWNIYDDIDLPTIASENVLLLKATNMVDVRRKIGWISRFMEMLDIDMVVDLYSTGNMYDLSILESIETDNYKVLYEYVDEISTEISGMEIPENHMKMHEQFLGDEDIYVVATAEKLYEDVLSFRNSPKNVICSGNGVDIRHFNGIPDESNIPDELRAVVNDTKPIIGYFGALAKWFDYELVKKAAERRPDYIFMLIGPLYGDLDEKVINDLKNHSNIIVTGAIDYNVLPDIANHFTVATIPFLINDITESTSPIKLFEYMSMGKPVVTTPMRECLKIPEVMIAKDVEEYVACIDHAVSIMEGPQRTEYEKKMMRLAENHSWDKKAEEIIDLLGNKYNG